MTVKLTNQLEMYQEIHRRFDKLEMLIEGLMEGRRDFDQLSWEIDQDICDHDWEEMDLGFMCRKCSVVKPNILGS